MSHFALFMALLWPLQSALCAPPPARTAAAYENTTHDHALGESGSSSASAGHHHGTSKEAPAGDDGDCSQHCTMLAHGVAADSPRVMVPPFFVSILPVLTPCKLLASAHVGWPTARQARERPPPDLLLQNSTFRI